MVYITKLSDFDEFCSSNLTICFPWTFTVVTHQILVQNGCILQKKFNMFSILQMKDDNVQSWRVK